MADIGSHYLGGEATNSALFALVQRGMTGGSGGSLPKLR